MEKVSRDTRLVANSTAENVRKLRILAAQVPAGDRGTVQDWLNYIVAALSERPELAAELYQRGKVVFHG